MALVIASPAAAATSRLPASMRAGKAAAEIRAEMKAQLRYNPTGKVLGPDRISYDHGRVIVTVALPGKASPRFTCATGSVCLFEGTNLTGTHAEISQPISQYIAIKSYLSSAVLSLHNVRTDRVFLNQRTDGGGGYVCYPAGAITNSIGTPYRNFAALYLADTNEECPAANP
jgi:hypothetical protein